MCVGGRAGLSGRIPLTCCKTQAIWALERHSQKDTQGRAPSACTQTRSSAPFPTLPSPERAHSPAFPSSQQTPVRAAPGPAHYGRRLYLPTRCPESVSPSTRAPLSPCSLATWATGPAHSSHQQEVPPAGSLQPSPPGQPQQGPPTSTSRGVPLAPTPRACWVPPLYLSPPLSPGPLRTASSHSPASSKFSLPAGRESPSSSHDREGLPSSLPQGMGAAAHYPAPSPRLWPHSPGRESLYPGPRGLRHQL